MAFDTEWKKWSKIHPFGGGTMLWKQQWLWLDKELESAKVNSNIILKLLSYPSISNF